MPILRAFQRVEERRFLVLEYLLSFQRNKSQNKNISGKIRAIPFKFSAPLSNAGTPGKTQNDTHFDVAMPLCPSPFLL